MDEPRLRVNALLYSRYRYTVPVRVQYSIVCCKSCKCCCCCCCSPFRYRVRATTVYYCKHSHTLNNSNTFLAHSITSIICEKEKELNKPSNIKRVRRGIPFLPKTYEYVSLTHNNTASRWKNTARYSLLLFSSRKECQGRREPSTSMRPCCSIALFLAAAVTTLPRNRDG